MKLTNTQIWALAAVVATIGVVFVLESGQEIGEGISWGAGIGITFIGIAVSIGITLLFL